MDLVVLGTGAGKTSVYSSECSSSYVLCHGDEPVILIDSGPGAVAACLKQFGQLPDAVYISHNHTDHAGELPVMLAVEASRHHKMRVIAHPDVMKRIQRHRIHELKSTGKRMDDFGDWATCSECEEAVVAPWLPLTLRPVRSKHSELCYGAVFAWQGRPVLGWSADSGWDHVLYSELSIARTLLIDARQQGNSEHAGYEQVADLARQLVPTGRSVWITGYGTQAEAPASLMDLGGAQVARPGMCIKLE